MVSVVWPSYTRGSFRMCVKAWAPGRSSGSPGLSDLEPLAKAADVQHFHTLCDQAVSQQGADQPWEVFPRQRLQANQCTDAREGQINTNSGDQEGHQHHRQGCGALDEGDLLRTQHVNYQSLREQAFNKPAGLE